MTAAPIEARSWFRHPPLRATVASLAAHFSAAGAAPPIRNPHHEPRVGAQARRRATPAAVLVPVVERAHGLQLLLTRRDLRISSPGQLCFPGGRREPADRSPEDTALREAQEEIALDPAAVRVLGRLGEYVSHSGFRITPVVGVVTPPVELVPDPREVSEIIEVPLDVSLDSRSYRLRPVTVAPERAYYVLDFEGAEVTGVTVSLLMGLYEALLSTHT